MSELVDWSPDSDYDVVKTNDPDGKKWQKMIMKKYGIIERIDNDN